MPVYLGSGNIQNDMMDTWASNFLLSSIIMVSA